LRQEIVDSTCPFILEAFEWENIYYRAAVGVWLFGEACYWLAALPREEPHLPAPRGSSVNLISPIAILYNYISRETESSGHNEHKLPWMENNKFVCHHKQPVRPF
jgi:hypothetical protein